MDEDSRKRRRVDNRLGELPDCLLQDILSRVGSRLAVQTSVLSRRWRHLWRDVPCVDIDQREFGNRWCSSFEDFADHMTSSSLPPQQLDAFRLHLVNSYNYGAPDRWIRRCLRRSPAAVHIHASIDTSPISYRFAPAHWPPTSSCSTGRLTRLRLYGVSLEHGFLERLDEHCPVVEDLHVEKCRMYKFQLRGVTSPPTLKRLAIIDPKAFAAGGAGLIRGPAPRLASLRLDLTYDGRYDVDDPAVHGPPEKEPEALESLVEASIRIRDTGRDQQRARKKGKLAFLRDMCSLLACLPNLTNLHLSGFTTTALLDEESREFPALRNLTTLLLEECDVGVSLQALTSILHNTPDLHKLGLHQCKFSGAPIPKRRGARKAEAAEGRRSSSKRLTTSTPPPPLVYRSLKSIEIKGKQGDVVKVLSEISKGMPEEMPLARWRRVEELSNNVDSTILHLFKDDKTH